MSFGSIATIVIVEHFNPSTGVLVEVFQLVLLLVLLILTATAYSEAEAPPDNFDTLR